MSMASPVGTSGDSIHEDPDSHVREATVIAALERTCQVLGLNKSDRRSRRRIASLIMALGKSGPCDAEGLSLRAVALVQTYRALGIESLLTVAPRKSD
jgi:hypothetical protein